MTTSYGFVGSVSQLSQTTNGSNKSFLNFSIKEPGDYGAWIECTLWGTKAEKLAHLITEGLFLVVEGNLSADGWQKQGSNDIQAKVKLNVNTLTFGGYSKNAILAGKVPLNQAQQPQDQQFQDQNYHGQQMSNQSAAQANSGGYRQ